MKSGDHKSAVEAVRSLIESIGGSCSVLHQSGRLQGSAGLPDLYVQVPAQRGRLGRGLTFWAEVKVARDHQRPEQVAFAARETKAGNVSIVTGGLAEVVDFLVSRGLEGVRI